MLLQVENWKKNTYAEFEKCPRKYMEHLVKKSIGQTRSDIFIGLIEVRSISMKQHSNKKPLEY